MVNFSPNDVFALASDSPFVVAILRFELRFFKQFLPNFKTLLSSAFSIKSGEPRTDRFERIMSAFNSSALRAFSLTSSIPLEALSNFFRIGCCKSFGTLAEKSAFKLINDGRFTSNLAFALPVKIPVAFSKALNCGMSKARMPPFSAMFDFACKVMFFRISPLSLFALKFFASAEISASMSSALKIFTFASMEIFSASALGQNVFKISGGKSAEDMLICASFDETLPLERFKQISFFMFASKTSAPFFPRRLTESFFRRAKFPLIAAAAEASIFSTPHSFIRGKRADGLPVASNAKFARSKSFAKDVSIVAEKFDGLFAGVSCAEIFDFPKSVIADKNRLNEASLKSGAPFLFSVKFLMPISFSLFASIFSEFFEIKISADIGAENASKPFCFIKAM